MKRPRAGVVLAALTLGSTALGCTAKGPEVAPVAALAAAQASAASAQRAALRDGDARYRVAKSGDPLDLQRLAEGVGASPLLEAVQDRAPELDTALLALPFAPDGEVAMRPLAEIAQTDAALRRRVLVAILGIASTPQTPRELLEPEGVRRCGEILVNLAADRSLPPPERALAISAARALSGKGYVDAVQIPTDLDPR